MQTHPQKQFFGILLTSICNGCAVLLLSFVIDMTRKDVIKYAERAVQMGTKAFQIFERDQCCTLASHNRAAAAVANAAVNLRRKGLANEYLGKMRKFAADGADPNLLTFVEGAYQATFQKGKRK